MLISKFDLYKSEWLELVFDDRNKAYGAYDLRQRYAGNMVKAMSITFLSIGLLCGASIILKSKPVAVDHLRPDEVIHVIKLTDVKPPITPPKPIEPVKPPAAVKTTAFVPLVVTPDNKVVIEVKMPEKTSAIGPVTIDAKPGGPNTPIDVTPGTGTTPAPAVPTVDNSIHNTFDLQSMPEPIGGEKAWSKFLSRNLRFPEEAQSAGASGRVIVGFVIEKDGSLSNITIERPAGNGFDEEAMRVLKMAKAWKPGMQNGQPVRVKFVIPINFQNSNDSN